MANMSYCMFENTNNDFRDCLYELQEANSLADMRLSETETAALQALVVNAREFLATTQPVIEMTVADVEKLVGKRVKIVK